MYWDKLMDGRQWFYDPGDESMWFTSATEDEEAERKRPYSKWLEMGWGLFPVPQAKKEVGVETLQATGGRRYKEMTEKIESGAPLRLDESVAAARTAYFDKYYATKVTGEPGSADITSAFKHLPPGVDPSKDRGTGKYENRLSLEHGQFVANSNYALPGGEMYYNPQTGNPEKISNSEIIFQQWRSSAEHFGSRGLPPMKFLQRCSVSGSGLAPLKAILDANEVTDEMLGEGLKFDNGSKPFVELLAVPNITAAIWLVLDHGDELGIRGIQSLTVDSGKNVTIEFIASKKSGSSSDSKSNQ
jgi:hypothetical protein